MPFEKKYILENTGQDLYFGHVFFRMGVRGWQRGRENLSVTDSVVSWPPFSKPDRELMMTLSWDALQGPHPFLPVSPWESSSPPPVLPHEVMLPLQTASQV